MIWRLFIHRKLYVGEKPMRRDVTMEALAFYSNFFKKTY